MELQIFRGLPNNDGSKSTLRKPGLRCRCIQATFRFVLFITCSLDAATA